MKYDRCFLVPCEESCRKFLDLNGIICGSFVLSLRATGDKDVKFKVLYCGICHTDLHTVKNDWGVTTYPVVPG